MNSSELINITGIPVGVDIPGSDGETRRATKAIFTITACLALIGNSLVLVLFARFPQWLRKTHNQCIFSLAITDILTAISLLVVPKFLQDADAYKVPDDEAAREVYCRLVWSHFIPFGLGITSVYTCLVLAIERWFAVMRPLHYKQRFGVRTMRVLVLLSWLAGFAFEAPVIARVVGVPASSTSPPGCRWTVETDKGKAWALAIFLFLGQTFLPCTLMVLAYLHILGRFRKERMFQLSTRVSLTGDKPANTTAGDALFKRATWMMAVASLALILCWLPNQIYFLLAQLGYLELKPSDAVRAVGVLVFCNSWMNPIIYGFMNRKFRREYRKLLCMPCVKDSDELSIS